MKTLALNPVDAARRGTELSRCTVCGRATCERKPFCSDHLDRLDYPRALMSQAAARDEELRHAAEGRLERIDPQGTRAREILAMLDERGVVPLGDVSRDFDLAGGRFGRSGLELARTYCEALERAGLVVLSTFFDRQGRGRQSVRSK